jgi:hypothetical protein
MWLASDSYLRVVICFQGRHAGLHKVRLPTLKFHARFGRKHRHYRGRLKICEHAVSNHNATAATANYLIVLLKNSIAGELDTGIWGGPWRRSDAAMAIENLQMLRLGHSLAQDSPQNGPSFAIGLRFHKTRMIDGYLWVPPNRPLRTHAWRRGFLHSLRHGRPGRRVFRSSP